MTRALIAVASLALSAVTFGQPIADDNTIERSFSGGGIVTLNLSPGDYMLRAGAGDRIRVLWRAEGSEHDKDMRKIQVATDIIDRVASIRTKGPTNHVCEPIPAGCGGVATCECAGEPFCAEWGDCIDSGENLLSCIGA